MRVCGYNFTEFTIANIKCTTEDKYNIAENMKERRKKREMEKMKVNLSLSYLAIAKGDQKEKKKTLQNVSYPF